MADTKISAMTDGSPVVGTDQYMIARGGANYRVTAANMLTYVTANASFSTANIANDAITYAKIQNVSATDKVLGRSTAGAGDIEEIACTAAGRALIDDVDAAAQRTTLGLGTVSTQAASAVAFTGGTIVGITDLAVADGGTGASTAQNARANLLAGMMTYVFSSATSGWNDGTADITTELKTAIETAGAAGHYLFIPPGTYWITNLNPDSSILIWAYPGTVTFINKLNTGGLDTQAYETFQTAGTTRLAVSAIATAAFDDGWSGTSNDDYVTELTVADNSTVKAGDVWVITSNDSHPYTASTSKKARFGEAFTVLGTNGSTKVYTQGKLRWRDDSDGSYKYATTIAINKVLTTRKIHIYGINFSSKATTIGNTVGDYTYTYGTAQAVTSITRVSAVATVTTTAAHNLTTGDLIKVSSATQTEYNVTAVVTVTGASTFTYTIPAVTDDGDAQGTTPATPATGTITYQEVFDNSDTVHQSTCLTIRNCPYAKIDKCDFSNTWAAAIRVMQSPYARITNVNTTGLPNAITFSSNANGRLGYGILVYGWCHGIVVEGGRHMQGRHAVTTGCGEITNYSAGDWYRQGQPTDVTFKNLVSINAWGPPFDTHEEANGVTFMNCQAYSPQRGPQGGSYSGYGLQVRCSNSRIFNYYQNGGTFGIRYASTDQVNSEHYIDSAYIENTSQSSNTGSAIAVGSSTSTDLVTPLKLRVNNLTCKGTGVAITTSVLAADGASIQINNLMMYQMKTRVFNLGDGVVCRVSKLFIDCQNVQSTGSTTRIIADMNGVSECYLGTLHLIQGTATSQPTEIFRCADSTAGKKVGLGKLIYEDPSAVSGSVNILESGDYAKFTVVFGGHPIIIPVGDETTTLTTGTAKVKYRMPKDFILYRAIISVSTAPNGTGVAQVDINNNGTSIFGTNKLTIDSSETSSETEATATDYSTFLFSAGDVLSVDIDSLGSGESAIAGLKIALLGYWI